VRDASGQLLGYEGMVEDTERKQVEEALAKRERYLAALVEAERKFLMVTETTTKRLELLGKVWRRTYVFENHQDAARRLMSQRAEWCTEGIYVKSTTRPFKPSL